MFSNVETRYTDAGGRVIHIPSEKGRYVGGQVRKLLAGYHWDRHYRHLGRGGHIGILHAHRDQAWFATADIADYFGSVRRNAVAAALRQAGVREHQHFAKWSTVKAESGGYVLPFGFPASTHLATLVMQESPLGAFLRAAARAVRVEVYLDDISLSAEDDELLAEVYAGLLRAIAASGFAANEAKSSGPARHVELFNCEVEHGRASVLERRKAAFHAEGRSAWATDRFERYCRAVEAGNWGGRDGL